MKKIIIYGAGQRGKSYYDFLKHRNLSELVYGFCDKNFDKINFYDKPVFSLEEAVKLNFPFLIGVGQPLFCEVKDFMKKNKLDYYEDISDFYKRNLNRDATEGNRDFCAYYHVKNMDYYFDNRDNEESLSVFWGESTAFYKLFSRMNKKNIVELACGRGRHVPKYLSTENHITLVDILEKNIEICKQRFSGFSNIDYYKNNGNDLKELPDSTYTALFTYDAMVHFELLDIAKYLQETYRILVDGGMGLFHHSNNSSDYKASFSNALHGRSFMSKDIFAHLAYKAGFKIIDQQVIDWIERDLDCLTLVQK